MSKELTNNKAAEILKSLNERLTGFEFDKYDSLSLEMGINALKWDPDSLQKRIVQNKIDKGFGISDINQEFALLYGEIAEAYDAWKHKTNLGEELADAAIYLLGLAEINGISLSDEIIKKVQINENRKYTIDERGNAFKVENNPESDIPYKLKKIYIEELLHDAQEDISRTGDDIDKRMGIYIGLKMALDTLNDSDPGTNLSSTSKESLEQNMDCSTCEFEDDKDSGECYECIKGIQNRYKPKFKGYDIETTFDEETRRAIYTIKEKET